MSKYSFERNAIVASCVSLVIIGLVHVSVAQTSAPPEPETVWDQVQAWYQFAKRAGERVPNDVAEWAKSDIKSIGDWEYMVFDTQDASLDWIQEELNRLGSERWECMWIESLGESTRFFMKRPVRSYLQHVPLSTLLMLMPGGGTGNDSN